MSPSDYTRSPLDGHSYQDGADLSGIERSGEGRDGGKFLTDLERVHNHGAVGKATPGHGNKPFLPKK